MTTPPPTLARKRQDWVQATSLQKRPHCNAGKRNAGNENPSASVSSYIDTTNPDYANLTPAQLYELNQNLMNDAVPDRPLIDAIVPLSVLRAEYEKGSAFFTSQIDHLRGLGFRGVRRTRGDGDCFYRSFAFAYLERLIHAPDPPLAVAEALSHLDSTLPLLEGAGFQRMVFEDFYDVFASLVQQVVQPEPGGTVLTPAILLEAFQRPEASNSIVVYLRFLTSAHMRLDADAYEPFIFHPETQEPIPVVPFCENFVEACGREADHVQVTALSRSMKVNVSVAYLDGRQDGNVDFVDFVYGEDGEMEPFVLLYR